MLYLDNRVKVRVRHQVTACYTQHNAAIIWLASLCPPHSAAWQWKVQAASGQASRHISHLHCPVAAVLGGHKAKSHAQLCHSQKSSSDCHLDALPRWSTSCQTRSLRATPPRYLYLSALTRRRRLKTKRKRSMRQAGASRDTQGHAAEGLGEVRVMCTMPGSWQIHLMKWATNTGQDAPRTSNQSSCVESAGAMSETLASGRHG